MTAVTSAVKRPQNSRFQAQLGQISRLAALGKLFDASH